MTIAKIEEQSNVSKTISKKRLERKTKKNLKEDGPTESFSAITVGINY